MTSKQFIKDANAIIKNYNCTKLSGENEYNINTVFGNLWFRLDPSPKIKVYSIFMRFTDDDKFNIDLFKELISDYDAPSTYSLKWNLHNYDAEYILDQLDERLNNFEYLNQKVN